MATSLKRSGKAARQLAKSSSRARRVSRGQFLLIISLLLLLLSNFFLAGRLDGLASGVVSSAGYVPAAPARDYAFWLAIGGMVFAVFLIAVVIAFNYRGSGGKDWMEESLI